MLAERKALAVIGRADAAAVELLRNGCQAVIDQSAHRLAVLQQERYFVRADFEDRFGAGAPAWVPAETGVEEAGIVDPELADLDVVRHHFGGTIRRNAHELP